MKHFCKNCKAEFKTEYCWFATRPYCPICGIESIVKIPEWETPEQYKERTGEPWPDEGPVWFKNIDRDRTSEYKDFEWGVCRHKTAKRDHDRMLICIQGPNPPPDGWRPEKTDNG